MILEQLSLYLRNVPVNPEAVFEQFSQEMTHRLGNDLVSLAVYGSAASGDYIRGRSNINMVFVMKQVFVSHLKQIALPVEKWMTRGFASPSIFSLKDLERSLDVFPLLFMEIRDNHRILYGDDPFKPLKITPEHLRMQAENLLKTRVAEGRSEFLASGESLRTFENMITRSFNTVVPILRAILFLKGMTPSIRKEVVVATAEEKFGLEAGVLTDALRHKMGVQRLSDKHNLFAFYERYMATLEKLADIADLIQV